jgi:DNA-binding NarL/FixJ family response regulator
VGENCRSRAGQIRTLVVDDSPVALRATRDFLASTKRIDVVGNATNGKDALVLAETLDPDLIVLDMHMPGMSGLDVLGVLRQLQARAKVIMVTAYFAFEFEEACAAGGALKLIQKEKLIDEFEGVVREAFPDEAESSAPRAV